MPIPNAMVLGQDDPSAPSRLCEPVFILRIRRKVVIVDMKNGAGFTERNSHTLLSKGTIKEEDGSVRLLRGRART